MKMALTYKLEPIWEFLPEANPLMLAHANELSDALGVPLSLDVGHYAQLFKTGQLLLLTARHDGAMVGYLIIQIGAHAKSQSVLIAEEQGFYLKPEYRKGFFGVKLLKLGIEAAKAYGAEIFFAASQECYPVSSLLIKSGFKKKSEIYQMVIAEPRDELESETAEQPSETEELPNE